MIRAMLIAAVVAGSALADEPVNPDPLAARPHEAPRPGVALDAYRAVGKPFRLADHSSDLIAVTWSPDTQTLFGLSAEPPALVELTARGRVVRTIELYDFERPSGLAHIGGARFALAEAHGAIVLVDIDTSMTCVDRNTCREVWLSAADEDGRELSCVAYDARTYRLYVAAAGDDGAIYVLDLAGEPVETAITAGGESIAGLHLHRATGELLVASDARDRVTAVRSDGTLATSLDLRSDWGRPELDRPSGITMDDDGALYVCCDGEIHVYRTGGPVFTLVETLEP